MRYNGPMTSSVKKRLPLIIFAIGTTVAAAIATVALAFFNPPQCPVYTEPKDLECVIGANVGLGMYLLLAIAIWVLGNLVTILLVIRNICLNRTLSKINRATMSMLVFLIASMATYVIVSLFITHVRPLVSS